jgi:hypothetical protein
VADASGDDVDRDAGQQQGGGARMPQVVQPEEIGSPVRW